MITIFKQNLLKLEFFEARSKSLFPDVKHPRILPGDSRYSNPEFGTNS